jgi:hypothetical protein
MSSWYSNSLTILALAAGALWPCTMPFSARAGDKIEFSAPGVSLEAPRVEREVKEPSNEGSPSMRVEGPIVDEMIPDSSGVVIISTQKRKDAKTSDPTFTDNRDNDANPDNSYDNLDSKQQPINGDYRWDMERGRNPYGGRLFSDRRSAEDIEFVSQDQDTLRTRLEAVNKAEKNDYHRDDRYSDRVPDANQDSTWSRGFFHNGLPDLNPMRTGQFMPLYDQMNVVNEQPSQGASPARPFGVEDEQLRESVLPPGMAEYNAQMDVMHGKIPDETVVVSTPRMSRPAAASAESQNPDMFARQDPPASPPGQVQSRPAILPYPKKPGSVLQ